MRISRYVGKDAAILSLTQGRTVLHLGCVGFSEMTAEERIEQAPQSLHWKLSKVTETVGIDYSKKVIDEYRRLGIFDNVICGDVQRLGEVSLDTTFEFVVAADIIEHISCPGMMLDGIKRFCKDDTRVIVTTPHAFGLLSYIRFLSGRFQEGNEHVMTFNAQNIENLLTRHGYRIENLYTCYQAAAERRGIFFQIIKRLLVWSPRLGGTLFIVARVEPQRDF